MITEQHSVFWNEKIAMWEINGTFNFWILNKRLIKDFLYPKYKIPTLFDPICLN